MKQILLLLAAFGWLLSARAQPGIVGGAPVFGTGGGGGSSSNSISSATATNIANAAALNATNAIVGRFPNTPAVTTNVSTVANLIAVVNTATSGTTIGILPGTYDLGTNNLCPVAGVNVIGAGSALVDLIGYADCWGRESFSTWQISGGPQYHPGDNSIHQGFTLTCDTNKLYAAFIAGTNSGMWSGFGVSSQNPPANTGFTNVVARDIYIRRGWWDGFHFNPSNRCEVRLEYCTVETEGLCYSFESGTGHGTNSSYVLDHCVGITRGRVPQALIDNIAFADPSLFSMDGGVVADHFYGMVTTNGGTGGMNPTLVNLNSANASLWLNGSVIVTDLANSSSQTNLAGEFNFNGTNLFRWRGDGRAITNTADLIAGSNITLTTNANGRSWTIASSGGGGPSTLDLQWRTNNTPAGGITNVNETAVSVYIRSNTLTATAITATGVLVTGTNTIHGTNQFQVAVPTHQAAFYVHTNGTIWVPNNATFGFRGSPAIYFGTQNGAYLKVDANVIADAANTGLILFGGGVNGINLRSPTPVIVTNSIIVTNGFSSRNVAGTNYFRLGETNTGAIGDVSTVTGVENNTNIWTKWAPPAALSSTSLVTSATTVYTNAWSTDESGLNEFHTNYFTFTAPATGTFEVNLSYITVTEGGGVTIDSTSSSSLKWIDPFASATSEATAQDTRTVAEGNGYNAGSHLAPYVIYAKGGSSIVLSNFVQNSYDGGGDSKSTNFVTVSVWGRP